MLYFHVDTDTFIRPQGRAPTIHTERGNIKVACAWDESHGCWQALDGSQHMPLRTITKRSLEQFEQHVVHAEAPRSAARHAQAPICLT